MYKNKFLKVSIVMGSQSDYKIMKLCEKTLKNLGVLFETKPQPGSSELKESIISKSDREIQIKKTPNILFKNFVIKSECLLTSPNLTIFLKTYFIFNYLILETSKFYSLLLLLFLDHQQQKSLGTLFQDLFHLFLLP